MTNEPTMTKTEAVSDERLADMLALIPKHMDGTPRSNGWVARIPAEEAFAVITELLSRRAANSAGGVEVKALEWEPNSPSSIWTGELLFGVYYTIYDEGTGWRVFRHQFLSEASETEVAYVASVEQAKAAAQADFNQRILSALAPAVEAEPVAEWRHKCAGSGFHDHDGCSCSDAELRARYAHPSSSVSAEVTGEQVERLARFIAQDIFGNSWDGQGAEGRCTDRGFKPFHFSMHGGMRCQGTQNDLRDVARAALAALNGGRENG